MGTSKQLKTTSRLTQAMLAEGESERTDFKRQPGGITPADLVAFANSENGGTILAGVDEQTVDGAQIGIIRGCDVSDATILQILNKAIECDPPVSININIENVGKKPILRIEIPSSPTKPHCTPNGIYCRRDGTRNRPLHPTELLRLFLETEAAAFAARFEIAAERITRELNSLESSLYKTIKDMSDQLGWAEYQLEDTEGKLDSIEESISDLSKDASDISTRLRTIFRQDKREDPIQKREHLAYMTRMIEVVRKDKDLLKHVLGGGELFLKSNKDINDDVTIEDARLIIKDVEKHIRHTEEMTKYSVQIKQPKDCSDGEIDSFATKVTNGGEVDGNVRPRVERAYRLGFIFYSDTIVGTAAIKKPTTSYKNKVFGKSKSGLSPKDYLYELGWIFLDEGHRKKGQMTRLLNDMLPILQNKTIFATTRASNQLMQEILLYLGFTKKGEDYESERQEREKIQLYVRQTTKIT
jgi:hypothetical protein